jgi:tetratricopeptide (TPR) repeat protein
LNRLFSAAEILFLITILLSCQSHPEREELAKDYYNLGNAYFELEDFAKAVVYYDRALQLDPSINQGVFNLARTNVETGQYKKSLKLLFQLQEKDPENIMILEMIAYTYYKMGDAENAVSYYRNILDIDLYSKRSLYNLSLLEKDKENWTAARSYLERLIELEDKPEYRILLAKLAMEQGDVDQAISLYEHLLLEDDVPYEVYGALKDLYIETEEYFNAKEMFDRLLGFSESSGQKGELLFEQSRIEFLYLEDLVSAQEHLIEALKAGFGFEDRTALDELIESVDPVLQDQIEGLIEEHLQKQAPAAGDMEKKEEAPSS